MQISFNRTRIAPTPSGYLHIGNVLSFVITASLARRYNASLLLRIDDLDRQRMRKEYVQDIFETLDFLGIEWQEGPRNYKDFESYYSQQHRMELYRKALEELRQAGLIFACACSRSQQGGSYNGACLEAGFSCEMQGFSWRLRTTDQPVLIKTLKGEEQCVLPEEMRYFIVKKKDGAPAYQLASVVDDLFYGVDLVVRGADLWPSTVAQHQLANLSGRKAFSEITFHHHALLTGIQGMKLSKSAGSLSVKYLRGQKKKPADIFRMIGRMLGLKDSPANGEDLVRLLESREA